MIDRFFGPPVRGFILCLIGLFLLQPVLPAHAQSAMPGLPAAAAPTLAAQSDPALSQLQDLLKTIEDPEARSLLADRLRTLIDIQQENAEKKAEPASTRVLGYMSDHVDGLTSELSAVAAVFSALPQALDWLQRQVTVEIWRTRSLQVLLQLSVAILGGLVAGRLAAWLLRNARAVLARPHPGSLLVRIPMVLLRTLVELVPVGAFALAGYGVLQWSDGPLVVRLGALTVINATVLIQAILAVSRGLLAPFAPGARLLPLTDETAHHIYIWVRRLAYVGVYGFFVSRAASVLGLPGGAYLALLKLVGLIVVAMLVVLILQNRAIVAGKLRGPPISADRRIGPLRAARRRLAAVWHVLTILYIVVIYGIWALNIPNGFDFMLRATAISAGILLAARIVVTIIDSIIRHGFSVPADLRHRFPQLEPRVNRYVPLLLRLVKLAVWSFVMLSLLQAWGVDSYSWLDAPVGLRISSGLITVAFILGISVAAWELTSITIEHYLSATDRNGARIERSARMRTLLPLLRNALMVFLVTVVALTILSELGMNIAPLLAGAGVIGLAIGFGSQTLVKDVITGLFILIEDTISVGDVVDVGGGHSGLVEAISIRTIKLRDLSGAVHSVPFSQVATVINLTKDFSYYVFDVAITYDEDPDRLIQLLHDLSTEMQSEPEYGRLILEPIEILGVDALRDSAVIVKARIKTRPIHQWTVGREFNKRLRNRFAEQGIAIPFPKSIVQVGGDESKTPLMDMARAAAVQDGPGVRDHRHSRPLASSGR
jgi:small-conductance mechanosensitive channel